MKILVINGPNLNLLGVREPELYGKRTYAELISYIEACAKDLGLQADCWQSNHEGDIVDKIQYAYGRYDAIIINAAAYTHTSVAILDALKAIGLPAAEVHLTDTSSREDFRRLSFTGLAREARFKGHGFERYREALEYFAEKQ